MPFLFKTTTPDIFGAFLVASSFQQRSSRLIVAAIAGGFFIDVIAVLTPVGLSALLYGGTIIASRAIGRFFHVRSFSMLTVLIAGGSLFALHVLQRYFIMDSAISLISFISTTAIAVTIAAFLSRS